MKCPTCQTENLDAEEFCPQCGARLQKICPKCGASNSPQYAFCGDCGHNLALAPESIPPTPEPAPVVIESEAKFEKVCPKCGVSNPPEYKYCGDCGYDLTFTPKSTPKVTEPVTAAPEPVLEIPVQEPVLAAPPLEPTAIVPEAAPVEEPVSTAPPLEPTAIAPEAVPVEELVPTAPAPEPTPIAPEPIHVVSEYIKIYPRVSTGIDGLDQLIGGGFLANKVYLVSGESGTGKTVFGLQYLYRGLIQGERGIYVSGDEKPSHLIVDAESLGWDFGKYVHERKLGLLDVAPHFAELRAGKMKDVNVRTVVADLAKHAKAINAKRIVIDPIAPLIFGQESSAYVQEYVRNLIFAIEDNLQCTILITSGIPSGSSALSRYGVAEFVAEGVIVLGMGKRDGQCVRTLLVRKMRSTPSDLCDHAFEIFPQRGIVIKE